jgi:hypothetical protein
VVRLEQVEEGVERLGDAAPIAPPQHAAARELALPEAARDRLARVPAGQRVYEDVEPERDVAEVAAAVRVRLTVRHG